MKKRKILLIFAVVVFVTLLSFFVWSSGPSVAVIKSKLTDVKGVSVTEPSVYEVDYQQLSLKISDQYVSINKLTGLGRPLYMQQLFKVPIKNANSVFGNQLAVTIGSVHGIGLSEVSDVKLRNRDKNYALISDQNDIMVFEKNTSNYEIGAFIKKGANYTSIVYSGPISSQSTLKKELNNCIESVIWH